MSGTWQIRSDLDVPMRVDADGWRTALCIGLQLLEREELVERLVVRRLSDQLLVARDPVSGLELHVELQHAWGAQARQAA